MTQPNDTAKRLRHHLEGNRRGILACQAAGLTNRRDTAKCMRLLWKMGREYARVGRDLALGSGRIDEASEYRQLATDIQRAAGATPGTSCGLRS